MALDAGATPAAASAGTAIAATMTAQPKPAPGCLAQGLGAMPSKVLTASLRLTPLAAGRVAGRRGTIQEMPYDEDLANRLRELVLDADGVSEMRMFGGLAFLINGNMAVAASGQGGLLLRVDPARTDELARSPHAGRFEMRGRAMDGWLRVAPEGCATKRDLGRWVDLGVAYARSLPAKR